jgi:hypothetical protein
MRPQEQPKLQKEVKKKKVVFFQATGILVYIGDSRGQRICVSVRYVERQKIEVARKREG